MAWRIPRNAQVLAVACALLALIAWACWPGLSGPFLFDDFANLNDLGAFGPMDDWRSFLYYLTAGSADPTGRPVAQLSFLLDGRTWPTDPWPFKRTNLVLHLLNTALLGWVVARLQAGLQRRRPNLPVSTWTPLLAAALWGAHPFFVSTTMYVVQREAMLPMTFVLLALLAWDRSVLRFADDKRLAGWLWATLGFGGCTLLAALSKANGFLAPLLVGLAYLWCLRPKEPLLNSALSFRTAGEESCFCISLRNPGQKHKAGSLATLGMTAVQSFPDEASANRRSMDRAAALCLALPSLLLLAWLVKIGVAQWNAPYLYGRDWTLPERLLSQPRALWDYVWHLALPRAGGGGLFVEGFAASRGWLQPATTLPAALALLASVVAAIAWRRRFPIASFAWLFFLAAHLLESSVVALELYFEHRNYLPAMFLGWPVAHLLLRPGAYPRYRMAFAALLLAALLLLTHQRATVWGNPALLTALSAAHQGQSVRSQLAEAQRQLEAGHVTDALVRVHALQRDNPHSVDVALNAIGMECRGTGRLSTETFASAKTAARTTRVWTFGMNNWLQEATRTPVALQCRGFGLDGLRAFLDAAAANPANQGARRKRDLLHIRGRIALAEHQPRAALQWFNAALEQEPDADYALVQAAALGNAGAQEQGVAHLDHYAKLAEQQPIRVHDMPSLHQWLLRHYGYYRKELAYLRQQLQADATNAPGHETTSEQLPAIPNQQ